MDAENTRVEETPPGQPLTDPTLRKTRAEALGTMRTEVTILFSDIKGSTSYFESKGDAEGLAMVQHHNSLLFPVIEEGGGRVVKTIGDAIMACFKDPGNAVKAAIRMQQVLEEDRANTQSEDERIHIRVALHKGPGLEKDNDVFGDVVNATAKVQQQADPDQIIITDILLDAARQVGAQYVKLGRAEIKGKNEAIEVYAVAWSNTAGVQLLEEVQKQFEVKLREARRQKDVIEDELENSREQWRTERRRLTAEIEDLEVEVELAKEGADHRASEDLQAQIRFQLDEAVLAKKQLEQESAEAQARWETERARLKKQVDSLQAAALDAMEQTHNPARFALAVREQVESRLKEARKDWEHQWQGERQRFNAEIERLKKIGNIDEKKDAARRVLLQKLGKAPSAGPTKSSEEFAAGKAKWDAERTELTHQVQQLQRQVQQNRDEIRQNAFQEVRGQYEPRLEAYEVERKRLREELESLNAQRADERQRLNARIDHLELAIPEAQEAVRTQMAAELQAEFDSKMEEINRSRLRNDRRAQDAAEEAEAALRRANKEISRLQDELKEAREVAFRAQRGVRPASTATTSS